MDDNSMPQATRRNARDDIFNGAHAPRTSRNAVELGMKQAECAAALRQFTLDLPDFCRRLDIPPALLNLGTPELLMIVCIRQQRIIDELAATVNRVAFPPVEDAQ